MTSIDIPGQEPGGISYAALDALPNGNLRLQVYSEVHGGGRSIVIEVARGDLIRKLPTVGVPTRDRSVADRLREIPTRPVLFTVGMEDGLEEYVLDANHNIRRTDARASDLEYHTKFEIGHFEMPPESDLTILYPAL